MICLHQKKKKKIIFIDLPYVFDIVSSHESQFYSSQNKNQNLLYSRKKKDEWSIILAVIVITLK